MLAELDAEHRGPLSSDLHRYHGLRWRHIRQGRSDWTVDEIADLAGNFPTDSATARAQDPEEWHLTQDTFLLRDIERHARVLIWQNTADGQGKKAKNHPVEIPLTKAEIEARKPKREYDLMSLDEAAEFLGWAPPT